MIILVINVGNVLGEVRINEVMADPSTCSNDDCEYIEIKTNVSINLTNWVIKVGNQNITFNFYLVDYLIITQNKIILLVIFRLMRAKLLNGLQLH